jgi:threonylcarbamoyladenosine tRNA methylthiotransferase MtaB
VLVNTCTVTARADQQARQAIRRLAREHPGAPLWVTGCYAQRAPAELAALPGVQVVFGNQEKARLSHLFTECLGQALIDDGASGPGPAVLADSPSPRLGEDRGGGKTINSSPSGPRRREEGLGSPGRPWPEPGPRQVVASISGAVSFQPWRVQAVPGHTRAWLKIQEGCSHHCRYCIVPTVRGPRRSLDPGAVLAALEELAALGYREVVLTGVDLGQYGLDHSPRDNLAGLVRRLAQKSWPFRVRLSSLEPQMVTAELLDELAAWREFCPHFHLPLQSGAAPVLAAMGRPYGPAAFRDLVREISRRFPGAGLGLDVLVGFPGETAADFEATRTLVASLPATYLHVFPFSPRPGTPAADLPPLPPLVVRERARLLRELGQAQKQQFLEAQLGQTREVLVEGPAPKNGWLQGLTDHYLRAIFPGPPAWRNRLVRVRFRARQGERLVGEPAEES